ncbi:hypothetical protein CCAX7_44820 [Capsulimonas corticalis]|uniref:Peptidase S9 prolyl oligopeptidase catalytic domain-containing protein n=1 Tax=Capsulimonas corticalis TaxID=2219043 RepID=A0A402CX58_9BACT|nr:prolyl oligopeptidase family serine peptidase [Capsulimonas corticalis]BDI32431.1 hypothetical protein CCAX7_44820 [Capsulimonas corticalis]
MNDFGLPPQPPRRISPVLIAGVTFAVVFLVMWFVTRAHHNKMTLAAARLVFTTHLTAHKKTTDPAPPPPEYSPISMVMYPAPLGKYPAYITAPHTKGVKYPAIIWLAGGFDNGIGDTPWAAADPSNDQSARAFPEAGIVTMYPSLRGGNNNPGYMESFYGEVNDVLAAEKYLAQLPYVDPKRIYLGGHSTGGTLALLADESTNQFRAVFSCGPVARATDYGPENLTYDTDDDNENRLRSPIEFLDSISTPTYIIEGTDGTSNIRSLNELQSANANPLIHFLPIPFQDHFSELAVSTPMLARWIIHDTGPKFQVKDAAAAALK